MKPLTTAPKGTQDVLPADIPRWHYVERTALDIAGRCGFFEMRTPTFEHTELFSRAVGGTTDVVQKEMYTFPDKKGRSITLRPEGTAGILRACIENGLLSGQLPVKASYLIDCFRYEKPQAGRLRQFHQFGVEALGSPSPAADAETIGLAHEILSALGVRRIALRINSIGCRVCRPPYHQKLREYFTARRQQLCATCLTRLETNPLRIIDCKSDACAETAAGAPRIIDSLCPECTDHFGELRERLDAMQIPYEIDPNIVRGLDYYVRTVFEFVTAAIGAQGTVCGGGRYDGLIEELGGPALPGVGFAMGIERLLLVMAASQAEIPAAPQCALYIAPMGRAASVAAGALVGGLRAAGIYADWDTMGRSLKAQMRCADRLGAAYTMVLGDNELSCGRAVIKEMATGSQTPVSLEAGFSDRFLALVQQIDSCGAAAEILQRNAINPGTDA